jgi:uncharacterized protein
VVGLLDVNVLIALLLPVHVHHVRAQRWLEEDGEQDGWATCAVTELGAIRICAQLPVQREPRATAEAILLLHEASRSHAFWSDNVSPAAMSDVRSSPSGKHVTDRYLLGLAKRHSGRIVTFDRLLAANAGVHAIALT